MFLNNQPFLLQAFGTFGLCQLLSFIEYVRSKLTQAQFDTLFSFALVTGGFALGVAGLILWASGSKKQTSIGDFSDTMY